MVYVSAPVEPPLPSDLELYSRVAQAAQDEIHAEAGPTALFRSSQRGCFQNGVAVCGSSKISSRAFQRALLWAKKKYRLRYGREGAAPCWQGEIRNLHNPKV